MCKCKAMLQPYADWLTKQSQGPNFRYLVNFTIVTNVAGDAQGVALNNTVSYGNGNLTLDPSGQVFNGQAQLYFNTSLWGFPGSLFQQNPFNPNATQQCTITIDIQTGRLTFSDPASNVNETADLRCANGLMYGFANSSSATPRAFLIGFTTSAVITPP
jgi:hypothetical protein